VVVGSSIATLVSYSLHQFHHMAWTTLSFSGLRDRLSSDELSRLLAECPTPEEKADSILTAVAQDVVSRVNAGRRKRGLPPLVNTGMSVPYGATRHAYVLTRRELTDSYPSLAEFNGDDRKISVEEANNYLTDLANNNADSDDTGAQSFVSVSTGSFRISGKDLMDFAEAP
jgi:hypothetical protein